MVQRAIYFQCSRAANWQNNVTMYLYKNVNGIIYIVFCFVSKESQSISVNKAIKED